MILVAELRKRFPGSLIANGGLDVQSAERLLTGGVADFVAFGRPFIANPDLPDRFRHGWPLAQPRVETFYSGGAEGYIDYPKYRETFDQLTAVASAAD